MKVPDSRLEGGGATPAGGRDALSVIVLCWNQSELALACARRVLGWKRPLELWLVDNGSDPPLVWPHPGAPSPHVLRSPVNSGFGGGINSALPRIQSNHVLLLNPDAQVEGEVVDRLVAFLDAEPGVFAVGPVLLEGESGSERRLAGGREIAFHPHTRRIESDAAAWSDASDVPYVPGAVALLRRAVLEELGGFDEAYFFGGEMADLCRRAREVGYRCAILGSVTARHDASAAGGLRESLYPYYTLRNRFLYVRAHYRWLRVPLLVAWTLYGLAKWAEASISSKRTRARALRLGLVDGVRGRHGSRNEDLLEPGSAD